MQGILFAEKPSARQLYLDARTKIILCLTVSFIMFSLRDGVCALPCATNAAPSVGCADFQRHLRCPDGDLHADTAGT